MVRWGCLSRHNLEVLSKVYMVADDTLLDVPWVISVSYTYIGGVEIYRSGGRGSVHSIAAVSAWSLFRTRRARRHHAALVCLALQLLQQWLNSTGILFTLHQQA
jgi:hypothetical protein